ncbi:MAG: hypothetical protein WCH05_08740 [Chlorobiaceae bacterium]
MRNEGTQGLGNAHARPGEDDLGVDYVEQAVVHAVNQCDFLAARVSGDFTSVNRTFRMKNICDAFCLLKKGFFCSGFIYIEGIRRVNLVITFSF